MITIYTDGACRGNQHKNNKGGWGCVLKDEDTGKVRHYWGHEVNTTNNRMEMTAVLQALRAIKNRSTSDVVIHSDSSLIIKGMNEWLKGWKLKGWKTAGKKPVENKDLWLQIEELSSKHTVNWIHVKGHSGNKGNELADKLANRGAEGHAGSKTLS